MKILVVHPDEAARNDIASRLKATGHQLTLCVGVHDAMALIGHRDFDCAILNEASPGTAGQELVEPLWAVRPELKIIVISDVVARSQKTKWITVPRSRLRQGFAVLFGVNGLSSVALG
jgi:DNA-binding NtrC family response regulator